MGKGGADIAGAARDDRSPHMERAASGGGDRVVGWRGRIDGDL
jgi:hypothetical protein